MDNTSELREKLLSEKEDLLTRIEQTSNPAEFGDDIDGFDEEADEAEEFSNQISQAEALRARVQEIEVALAKFADGKFGLCEKCQAQIPIQILNADPASRLCTACRE